MLLDTNAAFRRNFPSLESIKNCFIYTISHEEILQGCQDTQRSQNNAISFSTCLFSIAGGTLRDLSKLKLFVYFPSIAFATVSYEDSGSLYTLIILVYHFVSFILETDDPFGGRSSSR